VSEIQGRPEGLELVHPDDLLPVVDISEPVYPSPLNLPSEPYAWRPLSPRPEYPSTPSPLRDCFDYQSLSPTAPDCPPSPQYERSPSPQFPIEPPTPPRSRRAPPTPPRNPFRSQPAPPPFNPLRSRPVPPPRAEPRPEPPRAPTPPRPVKAIKKRKAIALEQRQLRIERRGKNTQRPKFCGLC
jgi:hypothetical protein